LPTDKPTKPAPKYEEFIKGVRLINLGMEHCFSMLERRRYMDIKHEDRTPTLAATYKLQGLGKDFFDAIAAFKLSVDKPVDAENGDSDEELAPLVIECTFEAHFHFKGPKSKALTEKFVDSELRLIMWPYFRQFVTDTTGRMTIAPLVVPLAIRESGEING
jgi:hypothetical protein